MTDINKTKILGMIAAAKLQLEELEFSPREFLAKLEKEIQESSSFEFPAVTRVLPPYGFDFSKAQPITC